MGADREFLRGTFERAARRYHQARPDYPNELYDELVAAAALRGEEDVLEIGCGTGKATIPLAERGFRVVGLELGGDLAATARQNLAHYESVEIIHNSFEEWSPRAGTTFDVVVAATAWHWLDPSIRYAKAWDLLRPGGHLAFWGATRLVVNLSDLPSLLATGSVRSELAYRLVGLDKEYPTANPSWLWPEYYAMRLLEHFARRLAL